MKRHDMITMAAIAIGTATLTVATFFGSPLDAGDEAQAGGPVRVGPEIAQPKLLVNGAELTLALKDSATPKQGDEPVFELTAMNTKAESVSGKVQLMMSAVSRASELSRVATAAGPIWQMVQDIELKPNEIKKIVLASGTKLPASSSIIVSLLEVSSDPKALTPGTVRPANSIAALRFSTRETSVSPLPEVILPPTVPPASAPAPTLSSL